MSQTQRIIEQINAIQESRDQAVREVRGAGLKGVEGGLRLDVFNHDANSEYDFTEDDCTLCELPEHAQNLIIEDIESENA
jgi:hypothetical protein|tara:strand:+ start:1273 stop:1512 length:240 start_codon:yes stop_codon:yes gene_type:complete